MRAGIVAVAALCIVLAGCGGDDEAKGVLRKDDLPKVSKDSDLGNIPAVATCSAVNEAQFKLTIGNKPEGVGRQYVLDNGDQVYSSALGRSSSFSTLEAGLDRVADAIAQCATSAEGGEVVAPMTGLDAGVVGYTASSTDADPATFGARVFAIQGDRLVVLGTRHDGKGDPAVDVVKLLPKALERAKEAPKD